MAFYVDEEEAWKCSKHPSKRRRSGVCPTCLRARLITLCPECANTSPCTCDPPITDSTSSSCSSSASSYNILHFSSAGSLRDAVSGGEIGRASNLIESEPTFRKSRSLAIPFLRSRSRYGGGYERELVEDHDKKELPRISRNKINFWKVFKVNKAKKCVLHGDVESNKSDISGPTDDCSRMMRSRSVAVGSGSGVGDGFSPVKHRKWYFPSPIKAFRLSKTSNLQIHERSRCIEVERVTSI